MIFRGCLSIDVDLGVIWDFKCGNDDDKVSGKSTAPFTFPSSFLPITLPIAPLARKLPNQNTFPTYLLLLINFFSKS